MNENKLMIAAAGSGKTKFIIDKALEAPITEKVLITTYTEANENEIKKRIIKECKVIPENITIKTWFSFLLQHGVRPYQEYLISKDIKGMILVNKKSGLKYKSNRGPVYYREAEVDKYYFNNEQKMYSDKISKFVVKCNEISEGAVIDRLSRIYSHIFIDEVQDLAGFDLELIKLLFQSKANILLVGDPRQVTYLTHLESKHKGYRDGKIKEFINDKCKRLKCDIDETTLKHSYRCVKDICEFASQLYPEYEASESKQENSIYHTGVFMVKKSDINEYLNEFKPIQLRHSVSTKVNEEYLVSNFGNAKGLTYERVLIYPTKPMKEWLNNRNYELVSESRSKFYVALTRAKYSVGIVYDYDDATHFQDVKKYK